MDNTEPLLGSWPLLAVATIVRVCVVSVSRVLSVTVLDIKINLSVQSYTTYADSEKKKVKDDNIG